MSSGTFISQPAHSKGPQPSLTDRTPEVPALPVSTNSDPLAIFPDSVNLLIQELVGGMLLSDKLEEIRNEASSTAFEGPNTSDSWEDEILFLREVFYALSVNLEIFANMLGSWITEPPQYAELDLFTDWMTGNDVVDARIAADCFGAMMKLFVNQIEAHQCVAEMGFKIPTLHEWLSDDCSWEHHAYFQDKHWNWKVRVVFEQLEYLR